MIFIGKIMSIQQPSIHRDLDTYSNERDFRLRLAKNAFCLVKEKKISLLFFKKGTQFSSTNEQEFFFRKKVLFTNS